MPVFPRFKRRINDLPDWPTFRWNHAAVAAALAAARYAQGRLIGHIEALGSTVREEAVLRNLTDDVVKSFEIQDESLDADQVRSSLARGLGMKVEHLTSIDQRVDGVVKMVLDATLHYDQPLTEERLLGWHAALFPTVAASTRHIDADSWGTDSTSPMRQFTEWFNADATTEPVLKAAVAHLWFATIRPFDNGNGRIARAIADMALARSEKSSQRFYSMSAQIREKRDDYHRVLEETQRGTLDVTPWMQWFLGCLTRSLENAQTNLADVSARARYWENLRDVPMNKRQRLVINKLLADFEGKLTTSKWAVMTKSSQDTALRDIQQLVERGVLVRDAAAGRSTAYSLVRIPPFDSSS